MLIPPAALREGNVGVQPFGSKPVNDAVRQDTSRADKLLACITVAVDVNRSEVHRTVVKQRIYRRLCTAGYMAFDGLAIFAVVRVDTPPAVFVPDIYGVRASTVEAEKIISREEVRCFT